MSRADHRNARFAALADELEADSFVHEDRELRRKGFPQQLIYAFRAAGLRKEFVEALPTPRRSRDGNIQDDYWRQLQNLGVPSVALPERFRDMSRISHRDADARAYANLASRVQPVASHTPSSRFNFGTPVRSDFGLYASHTTPGGPSPRGSGTQRRLFGSPDGSSNSLTPRTPFGTQNPAEPVDFLRNIDFAMPEHAWSRVRNDLLASNTCAVLNVFSITDKQFQLQAASMKIPSILSQECRPARV
jgi:hypothetical protein